MSKRHRLYGFVAVLLISVHAVAACGSTPEPSQNIAISADDTLRFSPSQAHSKVYRTTSGTETFSPKVTVIFKNYSSIQHHRWVLIAGDEHTATSIAAASETRPDFEPPALPTIIAQTNLLRPHFSEGFGFEGRPGSYMYICTVPGHYQAGMRGTLVIEEGVAHDT
jgi:uncharacterized cupredoxin-like copper-binding protein